MTELLPNLTGTLVAVAPPSSSLKKVENTPWLAKGGSHHIQNVIEALNLYDAINIHSCSGGLRRLTFQGYFNRDHLARVIRADVYDFAGNNTLTSIDGGGLVYPNFPGLSSGNFYCGL